MIFSLPNIAAWVILERKLPLSSDGNHDGGHGLHLHVLHDGARGDGDPPIHLSVSFFTAG